MSAIDKIITLARKEIGTVESPRNSNMQKYGAAYGWNGVAWCVIFVWWLFFSNGWDKLLPKKTASCSVLIDAAQRAGLWVTKDKLRRGDIVFYRFSGQNHTGICTGVNGKFVSSIEGNTAAGNDANGGKVMERVRNTSNVLGGLRPKYELVEKKDDTPAKHISLVAQECADGKGGWGTGANRKVKLKEAGYDPAKVQALINGLLGNGIRATVTASSLNLRKDADATKDNVKYSFERGTVLCIAEIKEGPGASAWGRVTCEYPSGKIFLGWVSMDWVSLD